MFYIILEIFKIWRICKKYLLYIPHDDDEGAGYLHIVNLDNKNKTSLIKDEVLSPEGKSFI